MATTRQLATIKDVIENKLPVSVAMRKNGYSPATAKNPKNLTDKEAFRKAVENYLPTHKLLEAHEEALKANKIHGTTDDYIEIPDHMTRLKAIDMAYKLKGYNMDNHGQSNTQINISLDGSGYIPPDNVLNLKPTKLKYVKRNSLK